MARGSGRFGTPTGDAGIEADAVPEDGPNGTVNDGGDGSRPPPDSSVDSGVRDSGAGDARDGSLSTDARVDARDAGTIDSGSPDAMMIVDTGVDTGTPRVGCTTGTPRLFSLLGGRSAERPEVARSARGFGVVWREVIEGTHVLFAGTLGMDGTFNTMSAHEILRATAGSTFESWDIAASRDGFGVAYVERTGAVQDLRIVSLDTIGTVIAGSNITIELLGGAPIAIDIGWVPIADTYAVARVQGTNAGFDTVPLRGGSHTPVWRNTTDDTVRLRDFFSADLDGNMYALYFDVSGAGYLAFQRRVGLSGFGLVVADGKQTVEGSFLLSGLESFTMRIVNEGTPTSAQLYGSMGEAGNIDRASAVIGAPGVRGGLVAVALTHNAGDEIKPVFMAPMSFSAPIVLPALDSGAAGTLSLIEIVPMACGGFLTTYMRGGEARAAVFDAS